MKNLLFIIVLLITATALPAQNITYRYDAAGNRTGRVISRQAPGSGNVSFDLGGHPPGIYLLVININGEQVTWKIVKE